MNEIILEPINSPQIEFLTDHRSVSLYYSWLKLGNVGTMADFLEWVRVKGDKGDKGDEGKSAYQSYLDTTTDNPPMSEAEWANQIGNINSALEILLSIEL